MVTISGDKAEHNGVGVSGGVGRLAGGEILVEPSLPPHLHPPLPIICNRWRNATAPALPVTRLMTATSPDEASSRQEP